MGNNPDVRIAARSPCAPRCSRANGRGPIADRCERKADFACDTFSTPPDAEGTNHSERGVCSLTRYGRPACAGPPNARAAAGFAAGTVLVEDDGKDCRPSKSSRTFSSARSMESELISGAISTPPSVRSASDNFTAAASACRSRSSALRISTSARARSDCACTRSGFRMPLLVSGAAPRASFAASSSSWYAPSSSRN